MDRKSLEFHKKKFDAYKNANPPMYRAMEYETVIIEAMKAKSNICPAGRTLAGS
jgi:hypothetical protein